MIIKIFAIIIMLAALFLLYRIAYPKQPKTRTDGKNDDVSEKDTKTVPGVVGKSRFVLPDRRKPLQTPTITKNVDENKKNEYMFAAGNENRNAVIPKEKLDEVFEEFDPDELEIETDENERDKSDDWDEKDDLDDESEDLAAEFEQGGEVASGMSIEEMTEAAQAIDKPTDEKAGILFKVEKTDMFEKLVSGDEGKAAAITAIIERHVQSLQPEVENENYDNSELDVSEFLGLTTKK